MIPILIDPIIIRERQKSNSCENYSRNTSLEYKKNENDYKQNDHFKMRISMSKNAEYQFFNVVLSFNFNSFHFHESDKILSVEQLKYSRD